MEEVRPAVLTLAPENVAKKYEKIGRRVGRSPTSAIKLKCIECCAWSRAEAKLCQIRTCALWEVSSRLLRREAQD